MKRKIQIQFIAYLYIIVLFNSCINEQKEPSKNIWAGTSWEFLEGESIKFKKPNQFKRSSRYRIEEDLATIAKHPNKLEVLQNTLAQLEFQDSKIDVFIDTTTNFRIVIMCNVPKIAFGKKEVGILKRQVALQNKAAEEANKSLNYGEVEVKLNRTKYLSMAKFKTKLSDLQENNSMYNSIYYLTAKSYTLVVYEFSNHNDDIEKYLWSVKG